MKWIREQQDAEENLLEEIENDTGEEYTGEWQAVKEDTETENGDDQVERQKRQIEDRDESYRQRLKKKLRVFAFRSRHLGGTDL